MTTDQLNVQPGPGPESGPGPEPKSKPRFRALTAVAVLAALLLVIGVVLISCGSGRDLPTKAADAAGSTESTRGVSAEAQPPTHVKIRAIGVNAPVVPVDTKPGGVLDPPEKVSLVGWWRPGSKPAEAGSTVLLAHVDSRVQGEGAFFKLRSTPIGAPIEVTTSEGIFKYKAVSRRQYDKHELPQDLFSIKGPPRLVLITCGGDFDAQARSYLQNIVVIAEAVD
ncbi:class F sortase [Gordonia sp. FQ]|uniref:class F sortase n=1 Tax=Gordonia sp. FQ TaxID=3446634 RepID=UPI003F8622C7